MCAGIGAAFLLATALVYVRIMIRKGLQARHILLVVLSVSMLVAELLLVTGLNRRSSWNDVKCSAVGAMLFYFWSVVYLAIGLIAARDLMHQSERFGRSRVQFWLIPVFGLPAIFLAAGLLNDRYTKTKKTSKQVCNVEEEEEEEKKSKRKEGRKKEENNL
jgi:hypothetical protein